MPVPGTQLWITLGTPEWQEYYRLLLTNNFGGSLWVHPGKVSKYRSLGNSRDVMTTCKKVGILWKDKQETEFITRSQWHHLWYLDNKVWRDIVDQRGWSNFQVSDVPKWCLLTPWGRSTGHVNHLIACCGPLPIKLSQWVIESEMVPGEPPSSVRQKCGWLGSFLPAAGVCNGFV